MDSANESRLYYVTLFLNGLAHTQNDPCVKIIADWNVLYCAALQWRYMGGMASQVTGYWRNHKSLTLLAFCEGSPSVRFSTQRVGNAASGSCLRIWCCCLSYFSWHSRTEWCKCDPVFRQKWPRCLDKCTEVELWIRFYGKCVRGVRLRGHNVVFVSNSAAITIVAYVCHLVLEMNNEFIAESDLSWSKIPKHFDWNFAEVWHRGRDLIGYR